VVAAFIAMVCAFIVMMFLAGCVTLVAGFIAYVFFVTHWLVRVLASAHRYPLGNPDAG